MLAICLGVLPLPWAVLTVILTRVAYGRMTSGMIPGDYRSNDAWATANRWAEVGYFNVLPLLMVGLAVVICAVEIRRRHGSLGPLLAILPIVIPLGAVCWAIGWVGLIVTLWNE